MTQDPQWPSKPPVPGFLATSSANLVCTVGFRVGELDQPGGKYQIPKDQLE